MNNFNNLTPFKFFVLQNFPYIEADFDALTNYELMCKIAEEINKMIDAINNLGGQVQYITNYFENLDVQEEIDNKLDRMAEDGTLEEIITSYLQIKGVLAFDTRALMKSAINLIDGSVCKTLGLETTTDGKGEFYKIRTITSGDVVDEDNIVSLTNYPTLIAEKIPNYRLNQVESEIITINNNLDTIDGSVSSLQTSVNNINKALNLLNNGKILIVGDSFIGQYQSDNWATKLIGNLGITDSTQYYIIGEGGAGIYNKSSNDRNFEDAIENKLSNIGDATERSKYTTIVIGGGTNDVNATSIEMIETSMISLINSCKSWFPNAKIYIAEFGWFMKYDKVSNRSRINGIVIPAYKKCNTYGAIYLNTELCYRDERLYESFSNGDTPAVGTYVHPNNSGQRTIADAVFQALVNGEYKNKYQSSNQSFPQSTTDVSSSSIYFTDRLIDGHHTINMNGSFSLVQQTYSNSAITLDLGVIGNPFMRRSDDTLRGFSQCHARLTTSIGTIWCMVTLNMTDAGHITARVPEGLLTTSTTASFSLTGLVLSDTINFDSYLW